ncbi:hypothetical protein DM867_09230 [Halosegnis rubeus]|uniref:Histidine kinase/HSP90-like ATPase domain-containing protein n=1 Tax=Halosegnis rubeus TaxID=2212850 RepID=A0A5N5U5Y8_9EURY|nr:HAMP domain-containing histidine kinase [Halosegnis rubeus]KAB7513958.1 hypothetical protein DM867_09230 [Halosegnis rubeus]KAB7514359.1 hypothetical protein DMP03_10880 [Halosegnis rubeus]KAB7518729.1 hypothetical protein DP108_06035 [Halosegnis rubeus]
MQGVDTTGSLRRRHERPRLDIPPGFSTKDGKDGIGMGMASVRQIVLAHGWDIQIEDGTHLDGVRFEIADS